LPEAERRRRVGGPAGEAALALYGLAGRVGEPLARLVLERRGRRGKEDPARRDERLGHTRQIRPAGPLVWVHAASVGETLSALPLIERLVERVPSVLLTTGTVTAASVAAARLPSSAIHQFAPVDVPAAVDRFLAHWRPDLALFAESELWPTTLRAVGGLSVPLAVFSARMSERSFRLWRAAAPLAAAMFARVDLFLAQSSADAERLRRLGAGKVLVCGNLKFDSPPPPADAAELRRLRAEFGDRIVLLAASTHAGEEEKLIACHAALRAVAPRLLTILAPRHPERGEAIAGMVASAGLSLARRSLRTQVSPGADVLIADTIGEMGLWYRLADIAFLGGSIAPRGGQNPIEAAKLKVPIVHGVEVGNFRDVYAALAGAVRSVVDAAALCAAIRELLGDPAERDRMARDAFARLERLTGTLDRTVEALEPYLVQLCDRHAAAARA
jgi:3-deoxy-D-manno-octulosonic-acid transferase